MSKAHLVRIGVLIILFLVSSISTLSAGNMRNVDALKGMSGVRVLIAFGDDTSQLGPIEDTLRTDIEVKLRTAGIKVYDKEAMDKEDNAKNLVIPILKVIVDGNCVNLHTGEQICAYDIELDVMQITRLYHDQKLISQAITWSRGAVGLFDEDDPVAQLIRDTFKDLTDEFINDYLKANQK